MLSVFVGVQAQAESLDHLVHGTLGNLVVAGSRIFESLHEINYCSFVDVEEQFGYSELNFWVSNHVLGHDLLNKKLLDFTLLSFINEFRFLNLWILRWRSVWRCLVSLLVEESVLLLVLRVGHSLKLLEVTSSHFLSHVLFAESAPVLGLAGLHSNGPLVSLSTCELYLNLTRADHLHSEGALVDFNSSFD